MKIEIDVLIRRTSGFALEVSQRLETTTLGLVGASGSGKSTLLDAIAGVEPGARIVMDGSDLSGQPLHRRRMGYVTQDAALFPHLSVRGNLVYSPGADDPAETAALLGIEGLLDRMPRHLSGGERRRVALGRAILSKPRMLLLDEPFAGLDEARRREIMDLVARLRSSLSIPMILVSHREDEIAALADLTLRLDGGKVVA